MIFLPLPFRKPCCLLHLRALMPKGIATSVAKTLSLPKARYPLKKRIYISATDEKIQTTLTGRTKLAVWLNQALRLELLSPPTSWLNSSQSYCTVWRQKKIENLFGLYSGRPACRRQARSDMLSTSYENRTTSYNHGIRSPFLRHEGLSSSKRWLTPTAKIH